jgi:hypothetical protein
MKEIKQFHGHSGSKIYLMQNDGDLFVRKEGNITRNLERYECLDSLNLVFPKIIRKGKDHYDMEYIKHLDMKTYLRFFDGSMLCDFILSVISKLASEQTIKKYSNVYADMIENSPWQMFSFKKDDFLEKLPAYLPCSKYHGDLTLENILFDTYHDRFVLIDPITTVYDSFVFDLVKLNQDLLCGWFTRNEDASISEKTKSIYEKIKSKYAFVDNKYLTILMLFRIMPYCKNENDKNFLVKSIEDLWM